MLVNSKNKVTSLRKLILESIGLSTKKAQIMLLKAGDKGWQPFSAEDYDQQVKAFANQEIAFRVYMTLTVAIDGRGQSYKQKLTVDPLERLQSCLKSKTHFWKTFMMRGQHKCLVMVAANKNAGAIIVPPDFFAQTFKEIGVINGSDIVLHEVKNLDMYSEAEEGGEEEHEEMEQEMEQEQDQEPGPTLALPEPTLPADPEEAEKEAKASEVLFDHESDSKNNAKSK